MLRRLFFVAATILMLSMAYHYTAQDARAQAPGNPVVAAFDGIVNGTGGHSFVICADGSVYTSTDATNWIHRGNVFAGAPVPTEQTSWGQLKARYRTR
jgi:predicted amidohydrolase